MVGVNRGYTVTTGLWARGMLETEYGVDLNKITWAPTNDEHVAEFQAPPNVNYSFRGKPIVELLLSRQIDAAIGDIKVDTPEIRPLIPDARNAGFAYFRKTGVYPINHALVIKNSILEAEPWIAEELFRIFTAAKAIYLASPADQDVIERTNVVGDPFPFGIDANRKALDTIIQFALDQGKHYTWKLRWYASSATPWSVFSPSMASFLKRAANASFVPRLLSIGPSMSASVYRGLRGCN